jgi:hypothetical protein
MTFVLRCPAGRIMNARSYGRLNLDGVRSGKIKDSFVRGRSANVRAPAIAAAPIPQRDEPLHSSVCPGERASRQCLSQVYGDEYGLLSDHCGRYCAPFPTARLREACRLMRGNLADGRGVFVRNRECSRAAFSCGTERCSRKSRSALARTSRSPMN